MKAVIFDMDGTLIDSEPGYNEGDVELFGRYGHSFGPDEVLAVTGVSYKDFGQLMCRLIPEAPHTEAEWVEIYVEHLLSCNDKYLTGPIDGAVSFVDGVRSLGLKTAIASSSPKILVDRVVDGYGLRERMDVIIHGGCVERGKPNPDIFLMTAEALGVPPSECVVVEDSVAGVRAGLAAGMTVAAYYGTNRHGFDLSMAQWRIDDYTNESWELFKAQLMGQK